MLPHCFILICLAVAADVQKGNFRVDTLAPELAEADSVKLWEKVFDRIASGEMPPKKKRAHRRPRRRPCSAGSRRN